MDRVPLTQEFQKELSQWRKDPSGSKKKPKYSYKTVEELKAKGRISKKLSAPQKELSQVKVGACRCRPRMGPGRRSYRTHQRRSLARKVPVGLLCGGWVSACAVSCVEPLSTPCTQARPCPRPHMTVLNRLTFPAFWGCQLLLFSC